jgi:ribosomal subunit interface protein
MRIQITYKGLEKQDKKALKTLIDEKLADLEKKLGSLSGGDVSIRGTLEKNAKHKLYRFGTTLHLPHKMIAAEEEGENVTEVISKTFSELDRQAQKHKSRLKKEHLWKRVSRRKKLKSKAFEAQQVSDEPVIMHSESWFDNIKSQLDDLYHFAVHEITYLQAVGDLTPDDMLPDELIDAVIVSAFEKQNEKPENLDTKAWLYQLAIGILDKEIEQSRQRRKQISLETVIPDEDIDTNIYEFYQPDEVLKLVDLIGVSEAIPESEKDQVMVEQALAQPAMTSLPKDWRRAAMLHYGLDFSTEQVAAIMRMEQVAVEDSLKFAAHFMADRTSSIEVPEGVQLQRYLQVIVKKTLPQSDFDELQGKFKEG